MSKQVILVTGASSGFGLMTARALAQAGHTVYASMRETEGRNAPRVAEAAAWSKAEGFDLRTVELDVQSDSSAEAGVAQILKHAGRLDVIVHNAGHMVFGPAEAFTPQQFIQQYDVNGLGAQRVNRAALPHMRGRRQGVVGLGRFVLDARWHAAVPGALFRRESGDGRSGGLILDRTGPLGDRDHHHGPRRLHKRHQPFRSLRQAVR